MQGPAGFLDCKARASPVPVACPAVTVDSLSRYAIAVHRLLGFNHRVSLTAREGHTPTAEANEQVYRFFEWFLRPPN